MSEYQYYEFWAIDRPLTQKEMQAVRQFSSRADISPTRFANEYNWGDFRGDPEDFLRRYFDAMVYVANWGTHRFMFRVPRSLLDAQTAKHYAIEGGLEVIPAGDNVILNLESNLEEGGEWEEGSEWMPQLAPIRAEVLDGDLRALYLAWLCGAQSEYMEEEDEARQLEPPVPPGLGKLSAAQQSLAEFLRIDEDLLKAAADASPPVAAKPEGMNEWLAALPVSEKDQLLAAFCEGSDRQLARKLQQRFRESRPRGTDAAPAAPRRTLKQLRQVADRLTEQRRQETARRRAQAQAQKEAAEAEARARRLTVLASRVPAAWDDVERLVASKNQEAYDQAVLILRDLRDLAGQQSASDQFRRRLAQLHETHARKSSFIDRLRKSGVLTPSQPGT